MYRRSGFMTSETRFRNLFREHVSIPPETSISSSSPTPKQSHFHKQTNSHCDRPYKGCAYTHHWSVHRDEELYSTSYGCVTASGSRHAAVLQHDACSCVVSRTNAQMLMVLSVPIGLCIVGHAAPCLRASSAGRHRLTDSLCFQC